MSRIRSSPFPHYEMIRTADFLVSTDISCEKRRWRVTGDKIFLQFYYVLIGLPLLFLLFTVVWAEDVAASSQAAVDPLSLYGPSHEFSVLRDGIPVGRHLVQFERAGEAVHVQNVFNIDVSFLGISLYRFDYRSRAVWEANGLQAIDITINDDGKSSRISGLRETTVFRISGDNRAIVDEAEVYPTNHWNSGVLSQTRLFNTLTGEINNVTITKAGEETVAVRGGTVRASRYVYDGELKFVSWYDRRGRWVKMKFKAKDNSDMVYYCETCPVEVGSSE